MLVLKLGVGHFLFFLTLFHAFLVRLHNILV